MLGNQETIKEKETVKQFQPRLRSSKYIALKRVNV